MSRQKRSEMVRARRNRRTNKSAKKRSMPRRKLEARTAAPMVSRGTMSQPPQHARTRKEARRRYNVALSAPHAELRLPAMRVIKIGWRLVSGLMTAGLLWALFALWTLPRFRVDWVEVKGLERLSDSQINQVLKLADWPIFLVDPQMIEDILDAEFPGLVGAQVSIGLPAEVIVSVGERSPVLAWEHAGMLSWLDDNGIAFLPRGDVDELIYVRVMGNPPNVGDAREDTQIITPQMVDTIEFMAGHVPSGVVLLYHPDHGLGWEDPSGWMVFFGPNPDKMDQRMAVYQTLVVELEKRGITPTLISVEYLHAPYYRMD